jgi:lipid II:glycine glycyltransferase (peptidoglycan interpeptide bridge formation enzyme)
VVSEFVRFSLFPQQVLPHPGVRRTDRNNVVCDLTLDEDALWKGYKHKVRKNVNKAQRSGVRIELDTRGERLVDFLRVYHHTMQRREAGESYYFGPEFFERLRADLAGQFAYFHAIHQGRIISTELVLISAEAVYSFLGGTIEEAFDVRPNDLLKHEVIRWAKAQGKRYFVLGGGYDPDDGIFQYKTAFAPQGIVAFQVGERVFDSERYEVLVAAKRTFLARQGKVWEPRERYFPAYRS